jgi:polysaccharide biosynthesis protein PslH
VDAAFFCPSEEIAEEGMLVFVGNFKHAPNLRGIMWFLKYAWPKIRTRYSRARLYIVGANPSPGLQEFDGQDGVTVTGWVEDVRPFMRRASVFVAPIFDGAGLRTKVLEAWAMERPVVGTRLAFEGLTSTDGTVCLMAEDADAFATRTCDLLENAALTRRMGVQARQLVLSSFSWEAFGEFYERMYTQILEPKTESGSVACPVGLEGRN